MSGELTMLVIRLVFLAMMWIFVFSIIYALRSDLFGSRSKDYQKAMEQSRQQTFAAAKQDAPAPVSANAAPPAAAPQSAAPQPASQQSSPQSSGNPVGNQAPQLQKLVITSGPKRGHELELRGEPISIGRARDADLVIQDDYTSTRHARLLNWNGQWMVQDLDSTNGTYVNGERVSQPTALGPGKSVRIGTTTFELQ
ncbi:FHA domain-containing protein [Gulosibacter macacae]|uniref:FHA domain-containing protein n=1 Tax=Gulosibacter macacae TaxID=2488791 RepID=A0A3P3VX73_9MICO|nr:FHA domain-containing protein [Gulosibacter macacae]RRJ86947.1 FHA domain-containing protein [Gulosibacter macacae]